MYRGKMLLLCAVAFVAVGCADKSLTVSDPIVGVTLTAGGAKGAILNVGDSVQLAASVLRGSGGAQSDATPINFTSRNQAAVRVLPNGVVVALAPGVSQIVATVSGSGGSFADSVSVAVTPVIFVDDRYP